MFGRGPAEPSSPSPLVAAPHPHKQRLTGLLGLPQLFQEPGGAQVAGCQPAPSSSRLVWALCCEYCAWHEPLPLLESRSAQSRAVHVARTTSPKEAPQQNSSSFCLEMFIFHMSGVPLPCMPTSLSLCCPTSIPINRFVAKGSAVAVLCCSCPQSSSSLLAAVLSPGFGWETGLCVGISSSGDTVCE